jgi:hypothetical protein
MSTRKKSNGWGGKRKGAGHPKGERPRMKICVSVDEWNWQAAERIANKHGSRLVDEAIAHYISNGGVTAAQGAS